MKPVVLALTTRGAETARHAAAAVSGIVVTKASLGIPGPTFDRIGDAVGAAVSRGQPVVGVCAAGILIRCVSGLIGEKRDDPPLLAISEDGANVVPLIGGHRGANRMAREIAAALSGHAALTTAGDQRFAVALDEPPPGWTLANPDDARGAMAALLEGARARLAGEAPWLAKSDLPFADNGAVRLTTTLKTRTGATDHLVYHPRKLVLGVGCERDVDGGELAALTDTVLAETGFAPAAIACVASLDVKADEPAVHALAERLGVPARFFPADRLEAETPRLANPSATVFREVGCHGVAEAAALAATGAGGELVVAKRKSPRATCAIAQAGDIVDPDSVGRGRGRLAVVGLGPGQELWRTPEASRLIADADVVVGYGYYLEQISHLTAGKTVLPFRLGEEEKRASAALALAGGGANVALVSSGDAGIYAMASLVYACLDTEGLDDGARRAEIVVASGISALQAAAARIGAPLGHDFCAISLSDLLTPWPVIERRVQAAAEGDFVVAFYNPVSQRRRTQLDAARELLMAHRPPDTPVVLARMLGRAGERIRVVDLAALRVDEVDMMTLVLVGSSQSRRVMHSGQERVYTPRGYRLGADTGGGRIDRHGGAA